MKPQCIDYISISRLTAALCPDRTIACDVGKEFTRKIAPEHVPNIPHAAQSLPIKHLKQAPSLFRREPVPDPDPKFLDALYPSDSGGQVRAEQASVRGFICQAADGSEAGD